MISEKLQPDIYGLIEYMFFIHSGIKLETDNWEITEKYPNICKLNTMVLNNSRANEKNFKRNQYIKLNKN